jgi:hypothetical protein
MGSDDRSTPELPDQSTQVAITSKLHPNTRLLGWPKAKKENWSRKKMNDANLHPTSGTDVETLKL